jgi:hypothetical protein
MKCSHVRLGFMNPKLIKYSSFQMLVDFELFCLKKKISIIESFKGSWNFSFKKNENPKK